jgi:hypothetical protein
MQNIVINANSETSVVVSSPQSTPAPTPEIWERPASWLPMPVITGSEVIFAALYPVTDTSYNTASITAFGNYIVDWGDGSIENYASGVTATHNYIYSSIPSATNTPFGYRQALLTITPQAGSDLTQIGDITLTDFLDVIGSGPNISIANITSNFKLQHIKWLGKVTGTLRSNTALIAVELDFNSFSSKANMSFLFESCENLVYVSPFNTFNITTFNNIFSGCSSLISCPEINLNNATVLDSAFLLCTSIKYVPDINLINPCSVPYLFYNTGLMSINITGKITTATAFTTSTSLLTIPNLDMSLTPSISGDFLSRGLRRFLPTGMKNSFAFPTSTNLGRTELIEVFNNLGSANSGATLNISKCLGKNDLTDADKLIATNKGWTLRLV